MHFSSEVDEGGGSRPTTTGHGQPILGVCRPRSVDEVVELVRWARTSRTPLYPVSRGLNWGYGSASPVRPGCLVVDLGGMDRIRNAERIGPREPVAVIEPGVTQKQLHEHLRVHAPQLSFNVTGSGVDTSILGNALDRGVGYFGPRHADMFGFEFVDGHGRVFTTGFRRLGEASPLAHSHPTGLGPMLDGLLTQSNFAIVTSACFRLMVRRPLQVAVSIGLRPGAPLSLLVDRMFDLKRDGLLTSVAHIGNRARTRSTLRHGIEAYLRGRGGVADARLEREAASALAAIAGSEWTALAALGGNRAQVRACIQEIEARLKGVGGVRVITQARLDTAYGVMDALRALPWARQRAAALAAARPLHGLTLGRPGDVAIQGLLGQFGHTDWPACALDASNVGLLYVSPALPADGQQVEAVWRDLDSVARRHGQELYATLNIETDLSAVAVMNLLFDRRSSAAVDSAHRCADALHERIRALGLEVYRARADAMPRGRPEDASHWALVREIKAVFDPLGLIAPGRYDGQGA